jgi:hypothetical protein
MCPNIRFCLPGCLNLLIDKMMYNTMVDDKNGISQS